MFFIWEKHHLAWMATAFGLLITLFCGLLRSPAEKNSIQLTKAGEMVGEQDCCECDGLAWRMEEN